MLLCEGSDVVFTKLYKDIKSKDMIDLRSFFSIWRAVSLDHCLDIKILLFLHQKPFQNKTGCSDLPNTVSSIRHFPSLSQNTQIKKNLIACRHFGCFLIFITNSILQKDLNRKTIKLLRHLTIFTLSSPISLF